MAYLRHALAPSRLLDNGLAGLAASQQPARGQAMATREPRDAFDAEIQIRGFRHQISSVYRYTGTGTAVQQRTAAYEPRTAAYSRVN